MIIDSYNAVMMSQSIFRGKSYLFILFEGGEALFRDAGMALKSLSGNGIVSKRYREIGTKLSRENGISLKCLLGIGII